MKSPDCEPVFIISVAARLLQMHPQTLRKYEREGLIAPSRTTGNLRLYSDEDLDRLRQVKYLVGERGLNLAGVQVALETTQRLRDLRDWLARQPEANEPTPRRLRDELGVLLESLGASGETARR